MLTPWFWIWLTIAIGFAILEMLSLSFYLIPFTFGALIALIAYFFTAPIWVQVILFILSSILAFLFVRPFARSLNKKAPIQENAIDRVINKEVRVIRAIDTNNLIGSVQFEGEQWLAIAQDSQKSFNVGDTAKVIGVDGTKLILKEI